MSTLTKLLIAAGVLAALVGAGYLVRSSIYDDGYRAGLATAAKAIDNQRAEVARKNATIVKGDQALIVAKTEDKEKIVTIYREIHEQVQQQIVEVPIYRACVVPADGLRLIARAAAGGSLPTDPPGAARDSDPATASPSK
jgi:hypothetical protein